MTKIIKIHPLGTMNLLNSLTNTATLKAAPETWLKLCDIVPHFAAVILVVKCLSKLCTVLNPFLSYYNSNLIIV